MYSKKLRYKNAENVEVESIKYFNLTQVEILRLNNKYGGDIRAYSRAHATDLTKLIPLFEDFIISAYGEKSVDGELFIKDEGKAKAFAHSFYYATLFELFMKDVKKFEAFIRGVTGISEEEWAKAVKQSEEDFGVEGE